MLNFALNSKKLKDKLMDTSQLISEVNTEYCRTMNKVIFDQSVKRGSSGCTAALIPLKEEFPTESMRKVRDQE
jgi:dynein heavy chain